jgi:hypothetical protein
MMRIFAIVALLLLPAIAQAQPRQVVATCGAGVTLHVGDGSNGTIDTTGADCVTGGSGGTITPGLLTIVPLDVATVTTGGTAVTALAAGHRNKGGFLLNPAAATINLCINEQTTASGTVSAGGLVCIAPSQSYTLSPSALGVSVVTSDSAHPFAGQGLN